MPIHDKLALPCVTDTSSLKDISRNQSSEEVGGDLGGICTTAGDAGSTSFLRYRLLGCSSALEEYLLLGIYLKYLELKAITQTHETERY